MSSNLKVNTILPSVGSNIGLGTNGGNLNVDGGCKVQVGTALTLGHTVGVQFATQNLHSAGFEVNQINASGIITASQFKGDGSNLTGLPAGTTINNNANNRIITGSGTANTLEGESNFTYDGNEVAVYAQTDDTDCVLSLVGKTASGGAGQAGRTAIIAESSNNSNGQSKMHFRTRNTSNAQLIAMTIDGNQNVGIGISSPDQTVHIHKGSAGSVSSTANTVLTLENSTTNILQFLNPNTAAAQVRFGDPQDDGAGFIEYSHSANTMSFGTNGPTRMQIDSNGHLGIAVASVTQLANSKQLTLRPSDDDGIRFVRPGDGNNNPNIHLDLTTTTAGSAFPSGEAYTTKYKTTNCDQIFETYEGGGTGGHISFRTRSSSNETFRIDKDGHVSLRNTGSSHQEIQWYRNTSKSATIGWGDGSANWEFKHFRADNQADNPYANIDFFTGSTTSPTRALRITEDGNHIREKHTRFATRIDYTSGNESANAKIPMKAPHVNVGGDFSDSNDRFTAPVDGDYAFWFHTNVMKSGSGSYFATWYKNGSEANGSHGARMYDQYTGSGWNNLSGCIMLTLQEGDYVELYNGTVAANYDGNSYGQFMGWLVG